VYVKATKNMEVLLELIGTDVFILVLMKPEAYKVSLLKKTRQIVKFNIKLNMLMLVNENDNNKNSVTKLWNVSLGHGVIKASDIIHDRI